uniref:CUB and sushi domain-containing protein 3-like n=1 Tax=Crassostrea virginica TaxID=6565 RepID=A0A8B8DE05_CRAVI|nr:CUB and sushi domain-containing protein 3-like [Crassostrea virginica]
MYEVSKRDFLGIEFCFSFYLAFLIVHGLSAEGHTNKTILYPNGTGVITSPGYPQNYPDNANYIWIIITGSQDATVIFSILDFKIPKPFFHPCDDYLKIEETDPCCFTLLKRCDRGESKPFSLEATGNKITISFVSDHKYNAAGFNLTWKVNLPETITTSTTSKSSPTPSTTKLTTATPSPSPPTTTATFTTTTPSPSPPTTTETFTTTTPSPSPPTTRATILTTKTTKASMTSHNVVSTRKVQQLIATYLVTQQLDITAPPAQRSEWINLDNITILVVGICAMQLIFAFIATINYVVKNRRSKLRLRQQENENVGRYDVLPEQRGEFQVAMETYMPLNHRRKSSLNGDEGTEHNYTEIVG